MKNRKILIWGFLFAVSFTGAICCDEDDDAEPLDAGSDSPEKIQCDATIGKICMRSCDCASQASSCMYYFQSETMSVKYDNIDECIKIETALDCMSNLADKDFNPCLLALQSASCGELFSEPGLSLPVECQMAVQ